MGNYRVKYFWNGEWVRTGLMSKRDAELMVMNLLRQYDNVEMYEDDNY